MYTIVAPILFYWHLILREEKAVCTSVCVCMELGGWGQGQALPGPECGPGMADLAFMRLLPPLTGLF